MMHFNVGSIKTAVIIYIQNFQSEEKELKLANSAICSNYLLLKLFNF